MESHLWINVYFTIDVIKTKQGSPVVGDPPSTDYTSFQNKTFVNSTSYIVITSMKSLWLKNQNVIIGGTIFLTSNF